MGWADFPWGALVAVAGAMTTLTVLALTEVFRRHFASRHDLNEVGRKVERNTGLFVTLDDRLGTMEANYSRLDERQTQQWERISAQMSATAETLREVTRDLKSVSEKQHDLALRLERHYRSEGAER